jgi:hypothetical protein
MSEYVNGIKINITDVVRIEFVDTTQNGQTLIHSIAMNLDTFKNLKDVAITILEEHEAKLAKIAKSN